MQDRQDKSAEQSVVELINNARKTILEIANGEYFTERLKDYLAPMQEQGPPYVDYEGEPRQVRQIKDIINALYHAEFVVSKMNLSWDSATNVHLIYDSAVKAAHHLTYLDLDIMEVFGGEIQLLIQELTKVSNFLNKHGQDIDDFADLASKSVSSYKVGQIAGMAINQLNPKQGSPDYPFLTQFSASLPGYIQRLTNSISEYSQTVATIQPHLNQERIDELKDGAITLLESINVIQNSSSTFLPFHLLHYIAILKQVATLTTATFDEIGLMNNASQDLVAINIRKLKLDLLPKLLAEVDKLEDQFLLRPGTLSNPLMQQLTSLYAQLINYASIVVDFTTRDEDLHDLDDQAFKKKRIQPIKDRIHETQYKLHVAKMASLSFDDFFTEIFSKNNANTPLIELDNETKKRLIKAYQPLQSLVEKISPQLHNQIVNGLTKELDIKIEKETVKEVNQAEASSGFSLFSPLKQAYNWWYSSDTPKAAEQQSTEDDNHQEIQDTKERDQGWGLWTATKGTVNYYYNKTVGNLINWDELQRNLTPVLDREIATHRFHIELNIDVLHSIDVDEEPEIFLIDEPVVLPTDSLIETPSTALVLSEQDISRSNFLIKHTKYSQSVSILRKHLDGLLDIFSDVVQQELKMDFFDELPFPELEDKNGRLAQSQQLIGIKSLFKMLYHLEQSIKQFEKLNTTSYQATFLAQLAGVRNHVLQLYNLAEVLYSDPHANKIYNEFLEQIMSLKKVVLDSTAPYLERPDETVYIPESNPLWLVTQAFLLIPEQIKAAERGRPLLDAEKAAVQESAVQIVTKVERIITNAGSYFKLFLEVPTFYRLFLELRAKLGEFATLSHGFAINHLSDINGILNKLLIEADKMELNFGLKPGFISAVLQDVFDQFMKGMLDPLNLPSRQYLELLTTFQPLLDRKRETSSIYQNSWIEEEELTMEINNLERFIDLVDKEKTQEIVSELKRIYLEIYPLLMALENREPTDLPMNELDIIIQNGLRIEKPLNQIAERVKTALAYQKGRLATKSFTSRAIELQRHYLDKLIEDKQVRNEELNLNYTEQALQNYLEQRPVPLLHYSTEYKQEFKNYLSFYKDNLINKARYALDIQQEIENEVQLRLNDFNQSEWQSYKQLDDFITALNAFDLYLTTAQDELNEGSSLFFETYETIRAKQAVIRELKHLAKEDGSPALVRVSLLQAELSKQDSVLLAYKHYEQGSFYWLIQCIVDLLEALHLYTPKYKEHYLEAVDKVSGSDTVSNYQTGLSFFERAITVHSNSISEDDDEFYSAMDSDEESSASLLNNTSSYNI